MREAKISHDMNRQLQVAFYASKIHILFRAFCLGVLGLYFKYLVCIFLEEPEQPVPILERLLSVKLGKPERVQCDIPKFQQMILTSVVARRNKILLYRQFPKPVKQSQRLLFVRQSVYFTAELVDTHLS